MFHLLTVFSNNAAEQEKYYLLNVLKKPQHVGMHQFMQCVEQLNVYVAQQPCWYYSPSFKPGMTLANGLFTEADLVIHLHWMCLLMWQDQFNLHHDPVDMCLLLTSLEAIEPICTQEKSNSHSGKKASSKSKTGNKRPGAGSMSKSPKKSGLRSIATFARSMGVCILRTTRRSVISMRKMDQRKPTSAPPRKAERNPILLSSLLPS